MTIEFQENVSDLRTLCRENGFTIKIQDAWYDDSTDWKFVATKLDFLHQDRIVVPLLIYKQGVACLGKTLQQNTVYAHRRRKTIFQNCHPDMVSPKDWNRPTVEDVAYSLFQDGSVYFEGQSFSDCCDCFGFSNDSINALSTYNECMETGRKLMHALPMSLINAIRYSCLEY